MAAPLRRDEVFYCEALLYSLILKRKLTGRRTLWCKKWLQKRQKYSHVNLLNELRLQPDDWRNYVRMDENAYTEILTMITPMIERQSTLMRKAISPHERLSATLRFLATGRSYADLKFTTAISPQSLSIIIPETCLAIYKVLCKKYMKVPRTQQEWQNIANEFEKRWNFPHCLGAVDGKHVKIIPPAESGSFYFNYKGFHSMVLMAVANANYEFLICEFGVNGRISDGGVIEHTTFYEKLKNNSLNIPEQEVLKDSQKILNYVFIGDEAFPLRTNFLKPFNQRELNNERKIFNYRLSRARRVIENTFGILVSRFRIFHTSINLKPDNIDIVVMTCCVLHNFLRSKYSSTYTPVGCLDFEDTSNGCFTRGLRTSETIMSELEKGRYRSISNDAKQTREQFMHYFNNEGSIPWQNSSLSCK